MAIHDLLKSGQATQADSRQAFDTMQPQPPQQPQQDPKATGGGFSFRNIGGLIRSPMGRTPASEVLSKLNKALIEVYNDNSDVKMFEITTIPIDLNNTNELNVSVLVVALRIKNKLELGVGYHTLIIEGSIEQPPSRMEHINGNNVEIMKFVSDANDAVLRHLVLSKIKESFPNSLAYYSETCVVPRDFNVTDTELLYKLAANAVFATYTELEIHEKNFTDLNLNNAQKDSSLVVRTNFNNAQTYNAVGQPIRSDVNIELIAGALTQQNVQNSVDRVSTISRTTGFLDLVWMPAEVSQNIYQQQQQNIHQKYAAHFVITALESSQLLTIPAQLFALVPALSLREDSKWMQGFRRQNFSNVQDMHDIGAIGIEVNFDGTNKRIDTRAETFKPEHHFHLMTTAVRPGLMISIDVPECGPDTWYNGIYGAAAQNHHAANAAIIKAANTLTNGAFGNIFTPGARICDASMGRIHLGHYGTSTGVRKDIRDIDHIAILNMYGDKDPGIGRRWSDTFLNLGDSEEVRLSNRKQMISSMFSDVVYTGYALRITFNPEFTNSLLKGCLQSGLIIRPNDPYTDSGNYERAAYGNATSIMMPDASGIFNRGFSNAQYGNNRSGFIDRW